MENQGNGVPGVSVLARRLRVLKLVEVNEDQTYSIQTIWKNQEVIEKFKSGVRFTEMAT